LETGDFCKLEEAVYAGAENCRNVSLFELKRITGKTWRNRSTLLDCDVLIVGGGINGVGIARDAAGRGLSVVLCEKDDLASHTSSASSKLIHGGLRYLEYYEFNLVRKALIEREVLLRAAPHIMRPLRFVMPHAAGLRPSWMIRAGLKLYDLLARIAAAFLGHQSALPSGRPAAETEFRCGYIYSDGWVDDARLVVLNAMDAEEKGAIILTQTLCSRLQRQEGGWQADLHKQGCGDVRSTRAMWSMQPAPGRHRCCMRLCRRKAAVICA
jgi:glycerol-3-phosphate dehydrogenase